MLRPFPVDGIIRVQHLFLYRKKSWKFSHGINNPGRTEMSRSKALMIAALALGVMSGATAYNSRRRRRNCRKRLI